MVGRRDLLLWRAASEDLDYGSPDCALRASSRPANNAAADAWPQSLQHLWTNGRHGGITSKSSGNGLPLSERRRNLAGRKRWRPQGASARVARKTGHGAPLIGSRTAWRCAGPGATG